jgi:hypothetical protein
MKKIYVAVMSWVLVSACSHEEKAIVNPVFIDSLITHYSPSFLSRVSDSNLLFWKTRMDDLPDNFVNGPEYASALASRFHLYGDIHDLLEADSLMKKSNEANQEKQPAIFRSLASFAMLQHQFLQADSFVKRAIKIENMSLPNAFTDFDVAFERGEYQKAKGLLLSLNKGDAYGYLFRRSKFEHYSGSLDTAIDCMTKAAERPGTNKYLKQVAYSNAADLCIHKGDLEKAANLYEQSILIDAADFHSLMGLGWIALIHDKKDILAEKIFSFVHTQQRSPDVLLKLEQVAEARGDSALQVKYANEFVQQASNSCYGAMYSKYLIDLYTGILYEPAKAVALAEPEIANRSTPQTFAWYAWSLYCNNEKDKAYDIFKGYVSGKPLEGIELYYMGKLMQGLNKGYNARQFFKAAYKNRYDLSPAKQKDLEKNLE